MGDGDEKTYTLTMEVTVIVTDLEELGNWVVDHLPDNSDMSYSSEWTDPDADDDGDEPEPVPAVVTDSAVYLMESPSDMLMLVGQLLPGTCPGIEVEMSTWDVD